jgi:gliding motility-associated-like protein
LALYDTAFCNSPDSIQKDIRIDAFVKAIFQTDALGCAPYTASFTNLSQAGIDFIWQFDNGTVFSTDENPSFTFPNPGSYRVRLIAIDLNTCNMRDTSGYFTINVVPKPKAFATWSPIPPQENVPVSFKNQSSLGATKYEWNFGDGESSTLFEPVHEYNETGTYDAELIAFNQLGCTDTFRMLVSVIVLPLLDVPNAFTPGQFGDNGIVKVRGFGITKLTWRIYNRWGQLVFESNNKSIGWDGKVKGKLQPVDVYTYTLEAEFSDGKKARKTGDITLLR